MENRRDSIYISAAEAALRLREGKIVAFPTETVYGLGADALNEEAVRRIFSAKGRPATNPVICHLPDAEAVFRFGEASDLALRLARFWPGPLTILLPHNGRIPGIVTAGSALAGFRVPDHSVALEILRRTERPVAAPSANLSNHRSPVTALMVERQLGDRIDGIVDGGSCRVGLESTVVKLEGEEIRILRPGGITAEELLSAGFRLTEDSMGDPASRLLSRDGATGSVAKDRVGLESPGNLPLHYAPAIPLAMVVTEEACNAILPGEQRATRKIAAPWEEKDEIRRILVLDFGKNPLPLPGDSPPAERWNLSASGDPAEAAHNLFYLFEERERSSFHMVLVAPLPETGLGRAVNDRLWRAATFVGCRSRGHITFFRK